MATDPLGARGSVDYHAFYERNTWLRQDAPFRVPKALWWQGPQGGQVLHWLGEGYLLGNNLGLSGNHSFNADKTRYFWESDPHTADDLYQIALGEVPRYLNRLQGAGYALDILLINTGGYYVDNSPPDGRWLKIIERWNAEHEDIKLRSATLSEWFAALAQRNTGIWPTHTVAWPDHWSHGLASATARIAQARRTQRRRRTVAALVEQAQSLEIQQTFNEALEQERFALEHTFNAWSSITKPNSSESAFQQASKELYSHRAELYLDEALGSALRVLTPATNGEPALYFYVGATLSTPGLVHVSQADLPRNPRAQIFITEAASAAPVQTYAEGRFVLTLPAGSQGLVKLQLESQTLNHPVVPAPF